MAERIIWTDEENRMLVGGNHPEPVVRYIRCDLYSILAGALMQIGDGAQNPQEIAWKAFKEANDTL